MIDGISPDTQFNITLGVAVSSLIALIGGVWKVSRVFAHFEKRWEGMEAKITAMTDKLGDSYTLTRASEVALRTAIENPSHRVPDPRNPHRVITVNHGGEYEREKGVMET